MCPPFWSTTHCKRRFYYPMLWSMKHRGSAHHSSMIACFSSSTVSNFLPWKTHSCRAASGVSTRFKSGLLGHISGSMKATFSRRRYAIVSHNVRWRTVLLQSPLVVPSSVIRFHYDKIGITPFVTLYSLYGLKIINFMDAFSCNCKPKWKLAPYNLAHQVHSSLAARSTQWRGQ